MKNNKLIIFFTVVIGLIFIASFSLAENDNEYERDGYNSVPATTISEPITAPAPEPVISPVITEVPQVTITTNLVDTDSDGIIDSLDKYPGEDDFAYSGIDANNNGVIDELEYLLSR